MSGEKDAGLKALQGGDVDGAIRMLELACSADPSDYQAHIYLGAAYSQAQRAGDAINVLTHAVELQPSNAQARYNLATAMERGGHSEQAVAVFEQAIMLQPDYPKALDALQRLKGGTPAPVMAPVPQTASAQLQMVHGAAPQYGAGAAAYFGSPPAEAQQPSGAEQPNYNNVPAGSSPPGLAQPAPLYGAPPAPLYGAPQADYPPQQAQPYQAQDAGGLANYGSAPVSGAGPAPNSGLPPLPNYPAQRPPAPYTPTPASAASSFEGSVAMALLFGTIGGVVGTALWVGLIMSTHHSSSWIGLGVGAIVGFLIRKGNGGGSTTGGILASVITIFSSVAGNLIAVAILQPTHSSGAQLGFSIAGIFIAYRIASS